MKLHVEKENGNYSPALLSGWNETADFIDRLSKVTDTWEGVHNEDMAEYEFYRQDLENALNCSELSESDKEIVRSILKESDPENCVVYVSIF